MSGLILKRKTGERILIGEAIWIEIVKIKGKEVSLRIDAPNEIAINREELIIKADGSKDAGILG